MPDWHDKPTGPGGWVCRGDGKHALGDRVIFLELTQEEIDNGAPFHTGRVYGPVPDDPQEAADDRS